MENATKVPGRTRIMDVAVHTFGTLTLKPLRSLRLHLVFTLNIRGAKRFIY